MYHLPTSKNERKCNNWSNGSRRSTHNSVEIASFDQGYTDDEQKEAARKAGIELVVVKQPEAKKGFMLLPKRWVVECSIAWTARFRRLALDFERTPEA